MINLIYLLFLALCILQPICLPVPEASTILTGTLTLGPNYAFIIGLTGIMIGIIFMYKITFFLGKKFLKNFKKSDGYKKYKKFMSSNPFLTTGILFAIPIIPDEIICIGSALGEVPLKTLFPIAIFSKCISVGMITYSSKIANILSIKQWQVIVLELLTMFLAAYVYKKFRKDVK